MTTNMSGSDADGRLEAVLPAGEFAALGAAVGVSEPLSRSRLVDVDGVELVRDGVPVPEARSLLEGFIDQRGQLMLTRFHTDGTAEPRLFWLSHHGVLTGTPEPGQPLETAEFLLSMHSGGELFRLLIDAVGLGPRPAPRKGFDPVEVPEKLLDQAGSTEDDGATARRARQGLGDRLAEIAPEVAHELHQGRGEMTLMANDWDGADGHTKTQVMWFDTAAGMVLHTAEKGFLGVKHQVEPAPAWVVWSHIMANIPEPSDVEWWFEQASRGRHR